MNTKEAGLYYAEQYGEHYTVFYGIETFTYAGHSLTVDLLYKGDYEEFFHIRSTGAKAIEGRTYPAHFAEAEASELIIYNFTGKGGGFEVFARELKDTVAELVNAGDFGKAN